jgi:hypothetical protein
VALCQSTFYRRSTRLQVTYDPNCSRIDEYLNFEFLENTFGYVVELLKRQNTGVAYLCFNWTEHADLAYEFFKSHHYTVKR